MSRDSVLETLEKRLQLAVTAAFVPATGTLTVTGDDLNNSIVVSRNAAGSILVNSGAVAITGSSATVSNTTLIQVFAQGGNDNVGLNEAGGVLPRASLVGGAGNDTLTGGGGNDQLLGDAGNDQLFGKAGVDTLRGGADNDTLTGGTGNDQALGEEGDDRMIWNPGEGSDLNEGGAGNDTVQVNGGTGAENFTATANGTRVRFDRVSPAPFSLDIGTSENLALNANGGDDTFVGGVGLAPLIKLTIDGGAGNDTLTGSDGADSLFGGAGNDLVTGARGNDVARLGDGDDTFVWNPGDGSDTVEGQGGGGDLLQFNGAAANEKIDITANGPRLRFFRDVGNVTINADDLERVNFAALGGADRITVGNLTGTDVKEVNLDLAGTLGGTAGDAAADTVVVNATAGDDVVIAKGGASGVSVTGLFSTVNITHPEPANDTLTVNLLAGTDVFVASQLPAGFIKLTADGGDGNDVLIGSGGNDTLLGGNGDDSVLGGPGNDSLNGSPGNDIVIA